MAREIEKRLADRIREITEKSIPQEIQMLAARIERPLERLASGDPNLEPDELQPAIEVVEKKRQDLIDA